MQITGVRGLLVHLWFRKPLLFLWVFGRLLLPINDGSVNAILAFLVQAKMVGLEHQVHLLSAQVQRLRFENSSLANQNELLSKVLVMKEGQVKVLRHESKVSCTILYTCHQHMKCFIFEPTLSVHGGGIKTSVS